MEALYEQRLAEGRQRYPAGFRLVAQPVGGADHGAPADWVILAPDESVWVPIGDDLAVPGRFVIDRGGIRLDVDYTSGRPVVDRHHPRHRTPAAAPLALRRTTRLRRRHAGPNTGTPPDTRTGGLAGMARKSAG